MSCSSIWMYKYLCHLYAVYCLFASGDEGQSLCEEGKEGYYVAPQAPYAIGVRWKRT